MQCNPFSRNASPAVRRYTVGMALTMSGYVLAVLGTTAFIRNHHPHGAIVYILSSIPSFCIFAMLGVVVRYLRDETDEYQRLLVVRSLLSATFITLAIAAYTDFLRSYGALDQVPAFSFFVSFWIIFGLAQGVQALGDRSHE